MKGFFFREQKIKISKNKGNVCKVIMSSKQEKKKNKQIGAQCEIFFKFYFQFYFIFLFKNKLINHEREITTNKSTTKQKIKKLRN